MQPTRLTNPAQCCAMCISLHCIQELYHGMEMWEGRFATWDEIYAIVQQFYAHWPCDTPKCDTNTLVASAEMRRNKIGRQVSLTHHKIGNSQVLFMICGSSQVSLPVMLYPFSLIIQQYSQGAEPVQQCVVSDETL